MLSGNDGGWWRGMTVAGWRCARGSRFAARGGELGAAARPIAAQGRSHPGGDAGAGRLGNCMSASSAAQGRIRGSVACRFRFCGSGLCAALPHGAWLTCRLRFCGSGPCAAMGRAAAPGSQRDNASSGQVLAPWHPLGFITTTSPIQIAVAPPSTVRQCPVVNAAPSLHRYNTALAISATVPMRPTGCMAAANSALRGSAS